MKKLIYLLIIPIILLSCDKDEDGSGDITIAIKKYVKDTTYTGAATVSLFKSAADKNNNAAFKTATTQSGNCSFGDVPAQSYYVTAVGNIDGFNGYAEGQVNVTDGSNASVVLIMDVKYEDNMASTTPSKMNIVLEDFTGVRCGYCPQGHQIAEQLENDFGDRIVAIGVNAGSYAAPASGWANFTTPYGQSLINQSGVSGYPAGTINRHKFTGTAKTSPYYIQKSGGLALSRGGWRAAAEALMDVTSPVNIATKIDWDETTRTLLVEVHLYYTETETETNNLNVAFIEDGQIANQSGGGTNYVHPNVLRDFITGQWGLEVPSESTTKGSVFKKVFKYTVPNDYNGPLPEGGGVVDINNCEVAVFVARGHTEILTGIKEKVIQ